MGFELQFLGATGEVTGSLYVIRMDSHTVLLECGLIQGSPKNEERNRDPLPVDVDEVDAIILSHAHIDHSGRVPRLVKQGYRRPVYVQKATKALCGIMLPDSGYLNEKDAEYENRKRRRRGQALVKPLYTLEDAEMSGDRKVTSSSSVSRRKGRRVGGWWMVRIRSGFTATSIGYASRCIRSAACPRTATRRTLFPGTVHSAIGRLCISCTASGMCRRRWRISCATT